MQAQGVPVLDQLADARLYFSGHRLQQGTSGVTIVCASRPFLEAYVRTRVRALPAVTVLDCCNSVGLMTTDDRSRVVGARIFRRADGSTEVYDFALTEGNGYQYEAMHVMECLREGKTESDVMPLDETLALMKTLDAIRAQWGLEYDADAVAD